MNKNADKKEKTPNYALPQILIRGTSAGKPLRKLGSLTCPYTGVKIIPGDQINSFEKKLKTCKNAGDIVELLSCYLTKLQPTEKSVYAIFRDFANETLKEIWKLA